MFPFTTCEINTNGVVAQPFSAVVNAMTCLVLLALLCIAKTMPVKTVLGVYALFEAWHAFSHMKHISGNIQRDVVHVLAYMMSFATFYAILSLSNDKSSYSHLLAILFLAIIVDIYIWLYVKGVWTAFSGLLVFAVILFGNYDRLPSFFKACIPYLSLGLLLLFGLIANENYNCERMMTYKVLPYHAIVEILGFVLFVFLAILFLKWEECVH